MKVIAYCALHYGTDYLAYAIRSVIDHVDELWVLYSAQGSHGHHTDLVCPDHAADLYDIAKQAAGDKLHWYTASPGQWRHEGEQREYIHQCVPDADVILVLDADEIWESAQIPALLSNIEEWDRRNIRLHMVHFWRSFQRCVTDDAAFPVRVIKPKAEAGEATAPIPAIAHMGYAQRSEIVEYKQFTHGHKGEWRKDIDWFNDRFAVNAQTDVHPTNIDYWNPVAVDWRAYMPAWMAEHPYSELDIIP